MYVRCEEDIGGPTSQSEDLYRGYYGEIVNYYVSTGSVEATHIIKTSYGTIFDTSEPFVFVIILLRNKLVEPFYNNSIIVVRSVKNERVKQNGNIFRIITTIAALLRQVENFRCYNLCG